MHHYYDAACVPRIPILVSRVFAALLVSNVRALLSLVEKLDLLLRLVDECLRLQTRAARGCRDASKGGVSMGEAARAHFSDELLALRSRVILS